MPIKNKAIFKLNILLVMAGESFTIELFILKKIFHVYIDNKIADTLCANGMLL